MIRVALLDDHPAVLAGLDRLLGRSEGLRTVALADRPESLFRALERSPPPTWSWSTTTSRAATG